ERVALSGRAVSDDRATRAFHADQKLQKPSFRLLDLRAEGQISIQPPKSHLQFASEELANGRSNRLCHVVFMPGKYTKGAPMSGQFLDVEDDQTMSAEDLARCRE